MSSMGRGSRVGLWALLQKARTTWPGRDGRSDMRPANGRSAPMGDRRAAPERPEAGGGQVVARCHDVARYYGSVRAVDGASLAVRQGQIAVIIGPSGCGKTTLLRLIAGFEVPDRGRVELEGVVVAEPGRSVPPERRRVGMVFQDYALFPHLSVLDNVAFGLPRGREGRRQALHWVRRVGLEGLEERYPHQLSGGQQQRVALARALAARPRLLLLDEPFASVDLSLRVRLRREVREIILEEGLAALFVTHDREEALSMGDLVAVMAGGRILQVGPPELVYQQPLSPGVAALLGEVNLLPGHAMGREALTPIGAFPLRNPHPPGPVLVMMRPEWLTCTPDPQGPLRVVQREFYGAYQTVSLRLPEDRRAEWARRPALEPAGLSPPAVACGPSTPLRVRCPLNPALRRGERVRVQALQPAMAWAQGPAPGVEPGSRVP